jgi:hypothetical protein
VLGFLASALLFMGTMLPASAIVFISTGDPDYNTSPPAGDLVESGWNLEGFWGNFLGTPIGPHHFLTARHVGGVVGDQLFLGGVVYTTTAVFDDATSDLRIWQVDLTFPAYAKLYDKTNEVGMDLIVFGRGTQRGDPININGVSGTELRGWGWGPADGRLRWGQNQVASIENGDQQGQTNAGPVNIGDLLKATFDFNSGTNEADLTVGDSGGAVFIQDGTTWKLAGINFAVDGPYSLTNSGPGFEAALFDQGGLYVDESAGWTLTPDSSTPQPGAFYSTRVSSHLAWIQNVLAHPVTGPVPVVEMAFAPGGPYVAQGSIRIDAITHTITIPTTLSAAFVILQASAQTMITSARLISGNLVLTYNVLAAQ